MKLKICGLKYKDNISQLAALNVDMIGFIFYKQSSRFVANELDDIAFENLPKQIKKVAVFVDETLENILNINQKYAFDFIQLHGNETPDFCKELNKYNLSIIKAFSLNESFDFSITEHYQPYCSYFLFDTKGKEKGGNGFSFNWGSLKNYQLNTPFLLSGGIGTDNIQDALQLKYPQLAGFDINSKIEIAPALKSVEHAKYIIETIKKTT
jgi:phosphoribosylanthranilate isomerase